MGFRLPSRLELLARILLRQFRPPDCCTRFPRLQFVHRFPPGHLSCRLLHSVLFVMD
jgi:hypothetical protein